MNQLKVTETNLENLITLLVEDKCKISIDDFMGIDEVELGMEYEFYDSLFEAMNDGYKKRDVFFDGECIEDEDSYLDILKSLLATSKPEMKATKVKSKFDEATNEENVTFHVSGEGYSWNFSHDSDWVDENIFNSFNEVLTKNTDRYLVQLVGGDHIQLINVSNEISSLLINKFELFQ